MGKTDYSSQAELIVKVIDIAIDCFTNHPPEIFGVSDINRAVNSLLIFKNNVINPEPRFKNATSLKYTMSAVLTYFHEGSGRCVDAFWKEVNAQSLNIKRVNNRFERILKRGKIKNHDEYDIIIDLYNYYLEPNKPSKDEIEKINNLIADFEQRG